ncbi:MAG: branched-chain amino acid aminotransferase [Alphaproteobacteria bacterium]|nr:branched-chain amino acid aminotransferase [Alphaproteobacteria bacterium]
MALIPFDDRDGFIWFNGKMTPWREAKIHVISHGLHYASSIFEGERAYNGKIFKSREHSERFVRSARLIDMDMPYSVDELETAKYETMKANNLADCYVRPVAWRGAEQMGIAARQTKTHVAIAVWAWPAYFSTELLENGITMQTSQWRKPAPETAPTASKTACLYAIGTMSKHAAENAGCHDALMLDYRGLVAEATGANLFMVKNNKIFTPIPDCFLNGITRQTVIEIAHELNIPLQETRITPEDLMQADEIFLSGTATEITPVGKIDTHTFNVGPVFKQIRTRYLELVNS